MNFDFCEPQKEEELQICTFAFLKESKSKSNPSWIITYLQDRREKQKSLSDYLKKTAQISTLQYTLDVKQDEIERLEDELREQEQQLIQSEKHLQEDMLLFDQFLETYSRNANDVTLRADEESRKKDELINEIKRLQKIFDTYQNNQNHLVDQLKQSKRYQQFLFKFAPQEWREEINQNVQSIPIDNASREVVPHTISLYFTKPEQLLDIFTDMEEKSLPLVQKSQYISEILDQIQATIDQTQVDQAKEVNRLQEKISQLEQTIKSEIEREISCQNLLIEYKNSHDDPFIEQIQTVITNLYNKYLLSDDTGLSTLHMLQSLEKKIKSLFNHLEAIDSTLITEAEKSREMTVRMEEHQEKLRQEKLLTNLKHEKAFLRASAPPYQKRGRKIMERSRPLNEQKTYQTKHSKTNTNQQNQWLQLLERI